MSTDNFPEPKEAQAVPITSEQLNKIMEFEVEADHPPIKHFEPKDDPEAIKADNARYATFQLEVLAQCWQHGISVGRILKLLKEQRDVIKFRADVLQAPYGAKSQENKPSSFDPLD